MTKRYLNFYENFNCLAGDCPDTCCAGWNIALSDEFISANPKYKKFIRKKCFKNVSDRCPLLQKDGLCEYIAENGQENLNSVCKYHPRYFYNYGAVREVYFSLSCPETAKLVINFSDLPAVTIKPEVFPVEPNDIDYNLFVYAEAARNEMLEVIKSEDYDIKSKLSFIYLYGLKLDLNIKKENYTLPDTAKFVRMSKLYNVLTEKNALKIYSVLKKCDCTRNSLHEVTGTALKNEKFSFNEFTGINNLLYAFVFDGILKAAVYEDVLSEVKYILSSFIYFMTASGFSKEVYKNSSLPLQEKIVTDYVREIEHDDKNLSLINNSLKNFAF